jgi:hypothetical protein
MLLPDAAHFGYPGCVQLYGSGFFPGCIFMTVQNPTQDPKGDWKNPQENIVASLAIPRDKVDKFGSLMKQQMALLREQSTSLGAHIDTEK